jgi:tetratricopeptide (TPR) repeat protein
MNGIRVSKPLIFVFLISISLCYADRMPLVRGHVQSDSSRLSNDMMAELQDADRQSPSNRAAVAPDGSFEFRDVATGRHTLRITTLYGDIICEQSVEIFSFGGEISIRLPKRPSSENSAGGTVSVRDLQRRIPPKAFRAFTAAQRDAASGDRVKAVRDLELAIRLYPEYADAMENLGVQYIRMGRYPEALEQFEKALATGESSAAMYANLGYGYYVTGRLQEAEKAVRQALTLDDHYARGHYLLGSLLALRVRANALENAPEAVRHLRLGAVDVPKAHLEIAHVYMVQGDQPGAKEELRQYLKSGDTGKRADAEKWLASLLKK